MAKPNPEKDGTRNAAKGTVNGNAVQGRDIAGVHTGPGHMISVGAVYVGGVSPADHALLRRTADRLDEAESLLATLSARQEELRSALKEETAKSRDLERQLSQVQQRMAADESAASVLIDQLLLLQEEHDQEARRVADLRTELEVVASQRRDAQNTIKAIKSSQVELQNFFASVNDLLELHYHRAEAELRDKERLKTENDELRRNLGELQRTLALYQG